MIVHIMPTPAVSGWRPAHWLAWLARTGFCLPGAPGHAEGGEVAILVAASWQLPERDSARARRSPFTTMPSPMFLSCLDYPPSCQIEGAIGHRPSRTRTQQRRCVAGEARALDCPQRGYADSRSSRAEPKQCSAGSVHLHRPPAAAPQAGARAADAHAKHALPGFPRRQAMHVSFNSMLAALLLLLTATTVCCELRWQ